MIGELSHLEYTDYVIFKSFQNPPSGVSSSFGVTNKASKACSEYSYNIQHITQKSYREGIEKYCVKTTSRNTHAYLCIGIRNIFRLNSDNKRNAD